MQASQTLRRPSNWQDFETLCKKLWGEIWNCPDIKKNGRAGQVQNGVDISGIPSGETQYFGIQCKGRDEYLHSQLNESEIENEIEKAKEFQPPLKKLIFATTAVKDSKIEAWFRAKNLEHIKSGLFEVQLYAWDDIVDLIDENKHTYDYYVRSQNYKTMHSVEVYLNENLHEITLNPQYKRAVTKYSRKSYEPDPLYTNPLINLIQQQERISKIFGSLHTSMNERSINSSYCKFSFKIHNSGSEPIEEYKILFDVEGEIEDISTTNVIKSTSIEFFPKVQTIMINDDKKSGIFKPLLATLVGDDSISSKGFFIKPLCKEYEILLNWKFLSKSLKDQGTFKLRIKPEFHRDLKFITVDDPSEERIESGPNEDLIETDKNDG